MVWLIVVGVVVLLVAAGYRPAYRHLRGPTGSTREAVQREHLDLFLTPDPSCDEEEVA